MKDLSVSTVLASGASSGLRVLSSVGRRLLVHGCALVAAGFTALSGFGHGYLLSAVNEALAVYIGLICLVPRGDMRDASWYIPSITGLVQGAILLVLGYPLPAALFFAGLQTWLQRLLQSRGDMGWEWTVSPMLLVCLFGFFQQADFWRLPMEPLLSFPVAAVVGWAIRAIYLRLRADAIHKKMLTDASARLQTALTIQPLPERLRQQGELLLTRIREYADLAEAEKEQAVITRIAGVSQLYEAEAQHYRAQGGRPDVLKGFLRSRQWQSMGGAGNNTTEEKCLDACRELNAMLDKILQKRRPAPEPAPEATDVDRQELARIMAHEDLARQLLQKKSQLPQSLACHVESLVSATVGICQNMRSDPQDRASGHKFLNRYLKATHRVVDEHIRLAAKDAAHEDVSAALSRSEDILAHLSRAFQDERTGMLRNDAVNYTAELNALEKLLKMRGH